MKLKIIAVALGGICVGSAAAAPAPGSVGRKEVGTAFDLMSWGNVDPIDKATLAKACSDPMRANLDPQFAAVPDATDLKSLTKVYDASLASGGDERALVRGCIEGMIAATKQRGGYVDVERAMADAKARPASVGLSLKMVDGLPEIASVARNGPAESKLRIGDRISEIDHEPVRGKLLSDITRLLRGPIGSSVELTVERNDVAPIELSLTRAMPSDTTSTLVRDGVGIIEIPAIRKDTPAAITAALIPLRPQVIRGYIIDLRSCPGGLLDAAIEIADLFIDQGVIAGQQGPRPVDRETRNATRGDIAGGLPIIVLTDHGTASGAEIVAAALRERRKAKILGQVTAGMGTTSTVINLSDRAAFSFTTARILQANGSSLEGQGVKPDIEMPSGGGKK